ncbi:MAG: hypothetical protein HUU57_12550 [Bdellovibrio sp.]|nr:hypothetical protein [Bdellovibrio sp.]
MKRITLLKISTLILASAAGSVASANNAITEVQTSTMQAPGAKLVTVMAGVEYSQEVSEEEKGVRGASIDSVLSLGYRTSDLTTVSVKGIVSKDQNGPQDTTVSNTQLVLGIKGKKLTDQVTTVHSVIGLIPTNEVARKRDRFKGGFALSNGVNYVTPLLTASYRLVLTKNIHEFNMNAESKANIEYTMANTFAVDVPVYGPVHVSADIMYRNGLTYGGSERSYFAFNADVIYDIDNNFSVNLGTSNGGNALKSNGVDSNVAVYDDKSSVFRAGVSYIF